MPRTRTRTTSPLPFRDSRILFLLMAVGLIIGIYRYDAQDIFAASLRDETVTGCDGVALSLSGAEAELLRLHNEARGEIEEDGFTPYAVGDSGTRVSSLSMVALSVEDSLPLICLRGLSYSAPIKHQPFQAGVADVLRLTLDSPGNKAASSHLSVS